MGRTYLLLAMMSSLKGLMAQSSLLSNYCVYHNCYELICPVCKPVYNADTDGDQIEPVSEEDAVVAEGTGPGDEVAGRLFYWCFGFELELCACRLYSKDT